MDNEDAVVTGVIWFVLGLVFAAASVAWFIIPIVNPATNAVNSYWLALGVIPGSHYQDSMTIIDIAINDSPMIALLLSGASLMVIGLRNKFSVI